MAVKALQPEHFPWFDYSRYTFSLGLDLGGGAALLSGHTASAFDTEAGKITVVGGLEEQVQTAYAKIEAILQAGGSSLADATRVVEYVRFDVLDQYAEIERVRSELLGATRPVVNTVVVRNLLRRAAMLEVEVTARRHEAGDPLEGIVYLPSITSSGGDLRAQTIAVLDEVALKLQALDLGVDAIVKITQYVRIDALEEIKASDTARRDWLGSARPALTQVPVDRLRDPAALVQLDVMASRLPAHPVDPGWPAFGTLGASPAVHAGRILFFSGQGGRDPQTGIQLLPGDVAGQAEMAYQALLEVLSKAGGTASSLVKTIEYTSPEGLSTYHGAVANVRARHLVQPYPASTGLVQGRLIGEGQQIEVDALALTPG